MASPTQGNAGTLAVASATFAEAAMHRVLPGLSAPLHASVLMALSMATHFFGYEFARSSNLSSFTSKSASGFGSDPGAFPLAMSVVSPFSVLLLLGYGRELDRHGPRAALRNTTLLCSLALSATAAVSSALERWGLGSSIKVRMPILGEITPARAVVWVSFVFQNSYAHLLYAQQWSFIGSVLTSEEGATWFASFAGLSSISSTVAGTAVSNLVERIGLNGLLVVASLGLLLTAALANAAYDMSERNGFDPAEEIRKKEASKKGGDGAIAAKEKGTVRGALDLFNRVPILGALFVEVISFQSLSTILNVCFVTRLKEAVTSDAERAAWTGQFYATVNGVSGVLQFLVLPLFMTLFDPAWVYRLMPLAPLACTLWTAFQDEPSLKLVAFSFFAAKVMDYTLRNVVNEMVYVPLDFDSRYKGKEIIGVFGSRFGKSGMSLFLSGMTFLFGSFGIQELSRLTAVASSVWLASTYRLSNMVPKRANEGKEPKRKDGISSRKKKKS